MKQLELNGWNGKGCIDRINETHGIDGMETRNDCFMEIMVVMKQIDSIELMESLNLVE